MVGLDLTRDFELRFQFLLFLYFHDELLDALSHAVEGFRELTKLFLGSNCDPVREVTGFDLLGSNIQIVNRTRDGTRELHDGQKSAELHQQICSAEEEHKDCRQKSVVTQ